MTEKKTRTFFIAQCGDKYVNVWRNRDYPSGIYWQNTPTSFKTKRRLFNAIERIENNKEKPNAPIIIKELRETVITEVVNEETL